MFRRFLVLAVCLVPFALGAVPQQVPLAEQVFKDVRVFKGVPAHDMIPAMEFMSASMGYACTDCHNAMDYAEDSEKKAISRRMVVMQREINEKWFKGKLEVTCFTCHNKKGHPEATPIPAGITLQHEPMTAAPKPADLFARHQAVSGTIPAYLVRTGMLTAPDDQTHEVETHPVQFVQGPGGKFRIASGSRVVVSDGAKMFYGELPLGDEPAAIFGRIARAWRGSAAFAGLQGGAIVGKEMFKGDTAAVVRGNRPATHSTEELWFDVRSGLLLRMVNIRRSTIGTVISAIDYQGYRKVGEAMVPMRTVVTFADGSKWTFDFKEAKLAATMDEKLFRP